MHEEKKVVYICTALLVFLLVGIALLPAAFGQSDVTKKVLPFSVAVSAFAVYRLHKEAKLLDGS